MRLVNPLEHRFRDRALSVYRRHDDVGRRHRRLKRCPIRRFPAHASRQILRALARTIHHHQSANSAISQVLHNFLRHSSGADNHRFMAFEIAEHLLSQFHAGPRHRHRTRPHFRFRAHAFPNFERTLKQSVQNRPGRSMLQRPSVCLTNLSQNFRFAEKHRIKPRGHAEQVPHRFSIIFAVNPPVEFSRCKPMKIRQQSLHHALHIRIGDRRDAIKLAAIACGQHQRFFECAAQAQFVRGA